MLVVVALSFWPQKLPPDDEGDDEEVFDPFAGGHPVPPLPGQTLPPSPRGPGGAGRGAGRGPGPVLLDKPASEEEVSRG